MVALLLIAVGVSLACAGALLAINTAQRPARAGQLYWRGILAGALVAGGLFLAIRATSDYRSDSNAPTAPPAGQTTPAPPRAGDTPGGIDTSRLGAQVYAAYAAEAQKAYKRKHGRYTTSVPALTAGAPELAQALRRDRTAELTLTAAGKGVAITATTGGRTYTQRLK